MTIWGLESVTPSRPESVTAWGPVSATPSRPESVTACLIVELVSQEGELLYFCPEKFLLNQIHPYIYLYIDIYIYIYIYI